MCVCEPDSQSRAGLKLSGFPAYGCVISVAGAAAVAAVLQPCKKALQTQRKRSTAEQEEISLVHLATEARACLVHLKQVSQQKRRKLVRNYNNDNRPFRTRTTNNDAINEESIN